MSARWGRPHEDRTTALVDDAGAPLLWALIGYIIGAITALAGLLP